MESRTDGKNPRARNSHIRNILMTFTYIHYMKTCSKCKHIKSLDDFYDLKRKRILKSGKISVTEYKTAMCKDCTKQYRKKYTPKAKENQKKRLKIDQEYKNKIRKQAKESYWRTVNTRLISSTKSRCKSRGIPFALTFNSIKIPEVCPILKIPFDRGRYAPTIDRIDPRLGYIDSNIRVISKLANTMKNDASLKELKLFSKNIIKYMTNDIVQTIEN